VEKGEGKGIKSLKTIGSRSREKRMDEEASTEKAKGQKASEVDWEGETDEKSNEKKKKLLSSGDSTWTSCSPLKESSGNRKRRKLRKWGKKGREGNLG